MEHVFDGPALFVLHMTLPAYRVPYAFDTLLVVEIQTLNTCEFCVARTHLFYLSVFARH